MISGGASIRRWWALAMACAALGAAMAMPASGVAGVGTSVPCGGGQGGSKGLIAAINQANAHGGGTIDLARGCTYTLSKGPFHKGQGPIGLPPVGSAITIRGQNSSIVRATGAPIFRLFQVASSEAASLTVIGTTLKNGTAGDTNSGGAILLGSRGALEVRHSTLSSNSAVNGGAIKAGGASVKIENSTLRGNRATFVDGNGGGVNNTGGPVRIDSSVIVGNQSTGGGGGVSGQSIPGRRSNLLKITDSTVSNNTTVENGGGGVFAFGPERLVISDSTIADNRFTGVIQAGAGGGIYNAGQMTVSDSTITGNIDGRRRDQNNQGGGIFNAQGAKGTITSTTIAGNRALGAGATGGGIANGSGLTVKATIVAGNRGGNCLDPVHDGGFNLEDGHTCGFKKHAVKADPLLAPLADEGGPTETMALKRDSPAINRVRAKVAACHGTVDQRGVPRPQGRRCDIGAFEVVKTRTSLALRKLGKAGKRVKLTATVKPEVAIPGQPGGKVVFLDRKKVLGKSRLNRKKPDTASLKARLASGRHRLKAEYKGSKLFLPSRARPKG